MSPFLPTTRTEMEARGWDRPDVVIVTGDAYVDHPAFGAAVIGRVLEAAGFRAAILPQPDWRSAEPFRALGRPRLFFGITGGNVDSMTAHFTPYRHRRKKDAYSPGGRAGMRPDRAPIVYAQRAQEAFPGVPVILGGLEASLRRLSHYDFHEDRIRRSILLDAKADLLLYGMAEEGVVAAARLLDEGAPIQACRGVRGAVYAAAADETETAVRLLPSFEEVSNDPEAFIRSFRLRREADDPFRHLTLAEPYGGRRVVVQTPPPLPASSETLDRIYELPYTRRAHPRYGREEVPALETVRTSLVTHRGCFGGCTFCSITVHQGRIIQSRSEASLLREGEALARRPEFRGTINDVGGPTANMYGFSCRLARAEKPCRRPHCLLPSPCSNLEDGHARSVRLLRSLRGIAGVRHVFVQSGLRHDLLLEGPGRVYLEEVVRRHVCGTLKVAPEHSETAVLRAMGKPPFEQYLRFRRLFDALNRKAGRRQFLVSYFISAHPGCGEREMARLRAALDRLGLRPEQVQDFTPLPGTAASVMYATGRDPSTGESLPVARTDRERRRQRRILQG